MIVVATEDHAAVEEGQNLPLDFSILLLIGRMAEEEPPGKKKRLDSAISVGLLLATYETGSLTPKATRSKQLGIPIHIMHLANRSTPSVAVSGYPRSKAQTLLATSTLSESSSPASQLQHRQQSILRSRPPPPPPSSQTNSS